MTTFAKRLAGERPDEVAISDEVTALGWVDLDDVLNRVRLSALYAVRPKALRETAENNHDGLFSLTAIDAWTKTVGAKPG